MSNNVVKKNGEIQRFNGEKIRRAIRKSANRVCVVLTEKEEKDVIESVRARVKAMDRDVTVDEIHNMVEVGLDKVHADVAKSYREYRDNRKHFSEMLDRVYAKKLSLNFVGDRSNANADSSLVTTKKAIVYNELNSELYKKFFLTNREVRAMSDGYIYIHDRGSRLDGINCFRRDTKFITSNGLKSFYDFMEGDEIVVLTAKGNWKKAVVHSYGWQPLQKVTFTRASSKDYVVYVTANHRWILKDGTETTNLSVGDRLIKTPEISQIDWESLTQTEKKLWCLGFGFADGSVPSYNECEKESTLHNSMTIRLCGHKTEFGKRFIECGYAVNPMKGKDDLMVYMKNVHFKELPYSMTPKDIKIFMNGYLSADGNIRNKYGNGWGGVFCAGKHNRWLGDFLNIAGYYTYSITNVSGKRTNFGLRGENSFEYKFYDTCKGSSGDSTWTVKSIEKSTLNPKASVWCLEVEDDKSFVLEHGIPTGNCCVADMKNLLSGGFFMGNLDYSEPKTLAVAFDLIGDVTMNAASAQYGGFTIPQIDKLLAPYAEKSYQKYMKDYKDITKDAYNEKEADEWASKKVRRDFEQGFQSWEMKFNSVASSRGDYPFTALTFGLGTGRWESMASSVVMEVRKNGQGKEGFKHPVLFPKLSMFYDENLHGEGKELEWLFDEAIDCSSKTMYPDYISLTGDGFAPSIYKKYGVPISRMGCLDAKERLPIHIHFKDEDENYNPRIGDLVQSLSEYVTEIRRAKEWKNGKLLNGWAKNFAVTHGRKPTREDIKKEFGISCNKKVERNTPLDLKLFDCWGFYPHIRAIDILKENGFEEVETKEQAVNPKQFVRNEIFWDGTGDAKALDIYFPKRNVGFNFLDKDYYAEEDNVPIHGVEANRYNKDFQPRDTANAKIGAFKRGKTWLEATNTFFKRYGIKLHTIWDTDIYAENFSILEDALGFTAKKGETEGYCIDLEKEYYPFVPEDSIIEVKDIDGSYTRVKKLICNYNVSDWLQFTLINGKKIIVTSDHPFIGESGMMLANTFQVGMSLIDEYGNTLVIRDIKAIKRTCTSYDIETESHTFVFNGIQSHNCRAQTSAWYERGGFDPADEDDKPIFDGRFNMGAISLHFPMIVAKAQKEGKDFYEVLEYYLDMVRGIHKRTVEYISHIKAGTNPLGFCQGLFLNGNKDPEEELGMEFLKPMTISFGITALNEASILATGKKISEDNSWAIDVLKYINEYASKWKYIDNIAYAIYGTPAESLCHTQIEQFRAKYGIIKDVSDHEYTTNSFHCCVRDDITPIEKQDIEYPMFHLVNGGNIQYVRYKLGYNIEAIKTVVRRAMRMGFYEGVNLCLNYCEDCGHSFVDGDVCPKCGSKNLTRIERMNGYLSYSKVRGRTMYADHKLKEFEERVSM